MKAVIINDVTLPGLERGDIVTVSNGCGYYLGYYKMVDFPGYHMTTRRGRSGYTVPLIKTLKEEDNGEDIL